MMNHFRSLFALLVCLSLLCVGGVALAASSNTADTVPTFKLTASDSAVQVGASGSFTITADLPGFATVKLLDASGREAVTLYTMLEVHTKANEVSFTASDADGQPLSAGSYTISVQMTSQFGVSSETVTQLLTIDPAPVEEDDEPEEESEDAQETASSDASSTSKSTTTASSTTTSASQTTETVAYTTGTSVMGEEGLEIGVGVGDMAEGDAGYWSLTSDATDAEIWAAITRTMYGVNVGENESAYIYDSPEKDRSRLGTVSGLSQGLNVIKQRDDGWSLVEAYRNEDGAFVRGYILTNKLRIVEPNTTYGIVIDKSTQTLTVYKDGARIGSCAVSTGLPTAKYLYRETPAGEFITVTRRGTYEYYGKGYTKYTIRINGSYYISEIPTTKKNGTDFSLLESSLGEKATRGNVCIAHDASSDGGINAEWIWNMTTDNKKVKVLIFDDKDRTDVPVGE